MINKQHFINHANSNKSCHFFLIKRERLLCIPVLILLSACTGYQYAPTVNFVPVNYEKNHFVGNLSRTSCQVGYAFSDHYSGYIMTNFRKDQKKENHLFNNADDQEFYKADKHNEAEIGITRFWNYEDFGSFEFLAGIGYGSVEYENYKELTDNYDFAFSAKKLSFCFQPSISVRYEKYFDFSMFSRLNYIRYSDINSSLRLAPLAELQNYDLYFYTRHTADMLFLEPGVQFKIGVENAKLLFQLSGSVDLMSTGIFYKKGTVLLGLSINFYAGGKE